MFYVYVYVLQSSQDEGFYIGFTGDLARRFEQHNNGESKATRFRRPLKLIYYEAYLLSDDAQARERFLKSGSGRRFLKKQFKHYWDKYPICFATA